MALANVDYSNAYEFTFYKREEDNVDSNGKDTNAKLQFAQRSIKLNDPWGEYILDLRSVISYITTLAIFC